MSVVDDEHIVGEAEDFLDLAGDDDDGGAGVGQAPDERVDFGACANVHTTRWFVQQQDRRSMDQPAGQQDFLLVAAGERPGGPFGICGAQFQGVDLLPRRAAFGGLVKQALAREPLEGGQRDVLVDGLVQDQALALAFFGDRPIPASTAELTEPGVNFCRSR